MGVVNDVTGSLSGVAPFEMPRVAHRFAVKVPASTAPPPWPTVGAGRLVLPLYSDGTIESVSLRIYPGPELDLRVDPYLMRFNDRRQDIISYVPGGKQYLDGDDDTFLFCVSVPAKRNELLVVDYWNMDANNDYDFALTIEVDYAGGAWRWPILHVSRGAY